jgi:hypothetical protein
MNDPREAIFSAEEIALFYRLTIALHQTLEIEQPEKSGWKLTSELRGEDQNDDPSPVLFNFYGRGDDERLVITSEFLHKRHLEYVGASNTEELDLFGPPGDEKTEQARRVKLWMGLIGRVFATEFDQQASALREDEIDMIGRMAWVLIQKDLQLLLSARSDEQDLRAKEAGTAYQSGLINFLVASGQRAKRGGKAKDNEAEALPLELVVVHRAWQYAAKFYALPTQEWIKKQLESEGIGYEAGEGREHARWRTLFLRAGLESLKIK